MASDSVDQVRERLDIVDLVGEHVTLRKSGRNFKGLCPFHQEKTPSFIVFPDSQTFHCFGCGAGGDGFNFVMQLDHVDFRGALEQLAARTGVELKPAGPPPNPQEVERDQHLLELNARAATWFAHVLWQTRQGEPGRQLLERRGIDRQTAERFQLGYAPDSWDALIRYGSDRGVSPSELVEAGLAIDREGGGTYDRFRDRLIFPIQDKDGRVVGFGGRAMGDVQPKYLNTPQTAVFDKGKNLYALHLAQEAIRRTRDVIVVEGYMDAIAAHQFGFENVVASMGTALTSDQVRLIRRAVDRILLALDADAAGQLATVRGLDVLREGLSEANRPTTDAAGLVRFERTLKTDIRIVRLPSGKDPDELIRSDVESWRHAVESPIPFVDFYIDTVVGKKRQFDPREKSDMVQQLAPVLREIGDRIVQAHYVAKIAHRLNISEQLILSSAPRRSKSFRGSTEQLVQSTPKAVNSEDHLFALLLRHPLILGPLIDEIPENEIVDARDVEILRELKSFAPETTEAALDLIDGEIRVHAESLLALIGDRPLSQSGHARREAESALRRLRKEHHDYQMQQILADVAAAERDGDQETLRHSMLLIDQIKEHYPEFYPEPSPYFRDVRDSVT